MRAIGQHFPQRPGSRPQRYQPEHSEAWQKGDASTEVFYVYILKLSNGKYYVGQTRDLRARLLEHRDGKVASTAEQKPKLQWFDSVPSREEAALKEAHLKELNDRNPREIRKMIIAFNDLVKEMKYPG